MKKNIFDKLGDWIYNAVLSVPVNAKITGIILLPVLVLGISLNYWITTGLSDWLSYLLTDVRVNAAMRAGSRSVTLVKVLAAAGSIIMASFLTFILTRPLLALREMAQKVAEGDFEARSPVWSNDEIGEVAVAVNQMTDHLVTAQDELARSNRRLTAINRIILAADRETEIHDVLYAVLENILAVMRLKTGWVYLRDPERDQFHLASWFNVPSELEPYLAHQAENELCACQQDFMEGNLETWVNLLTCHRLENCTCLSLDTRHITIPIEVHDQKFGVMNLLCEKVQVLSDEDKDLLAAIGIQVSEIVANAWLRLKLAEKEMARQALLESLVEAQEEERSRLARELHDGAGQMLTSLLVQIKVLEKNPSSIEMDRNIENILETVSETIEQVREISYRLRPAALEEFGLAVALETLTNDITRGTGLIVHCSCNLDDIQLPTGVQVTFYRIAQEALTNVLRHANANTVIVELSQIADKICMSITDDGCGFVPGPGSIKWGQRHLGLVSMQERASMAGGSLDIDTSPGEGTTIRACIPVGPERFGQT